MQVRATDAMGFAIAPAIRNQPVAAEVDRGRQRDVLRWLVLAAVLLAAALFDAWQRYGIVDYGFKSSTARSERAVEEMKGRTLSIEIASLSAPRRIEELAKQLQLEAPAPSDAIVIERIVPPDPPPSSVIASR